KVVMKMRLPVFLILTVACLQVGASAIGQQITLSETNATLERIFKRLRKQSNVDFVCSSEQLRRASRVTLHVTNEPLKDVLDKIFVNQPLSYTLKNKTIVVQDKPEAYKTLEKPVLINSTHRSTLSLLTLAPPELPTKVRMERIPVSGLVLDDQGEPLPGVSILIKGTQQGTITDSEGRFSIQIPDENTVLVFSFVGYISQEITVGNRTHIDISLVSDQKALEEVVVVGYGTMKRSSLTGAISTIDTKQIESFPSVNALNSLQGQAAGVFISPSRQPGEDPSIRIRGSRSLSASNSPLLIIDGMPGSWDNLASNDIESIEVLKDAAATAIYGSRAANGVILV